MPRRCVLSDWAAPWPRDDDFVVRELPAYLPCGQGEHVYVHVYKRQLTTMQVVNRLASAFGVRGRNIGYAGLKDRAALTSQWFSIPFREAPQAALERLGGDASLWVSECSRHGNKLRTGHSRGNAFSLRLAEASPERLADLKERLDSLAQFGMPNYYGRQRFGSDAGNVERALSQLARGTLQETRVGRLLVSALQSAVFNLCVGMRAEALGWDTLCEGDVMQRVDNGACFLCEDVERESARMQAGEVVWTAPILGPKSLQSGARAREFEDAAARAVGLSLRDGQWWPLSEAGRWARGSRRAALVRPLGVELRRGSEGEATPWSESEAEAERFWLDVSLPTGSYVSVLLRELLFESDVDRPDRAESCSEEYAG
ncbi:MAG: tRNA pseudouridine(13) synthase TruD [Myxococcota bacterium]|jgi:tRNA pseudouridine13 synthase|nr:tRNA pseudouridine(13) synthase TruD [Myxococcota bacterium]